MISMETGQVELVLSSDFEVRSARCEQCACVHRLRDLLSAGVRARPDARRPSIYDITDGSDVYLFHVIATDRVELLACRHSAESADTATEIQRQFDETLTLTASGVGT